MSTTNTNNTNNSVATVLAQAEQVVQAQRKRIAQLKIEKIEAAERCIRLMGAPNLKKYPVEVKAAPGKGNGVFATRTIKKGETCCFYDGVFLETDTMAGHRNWHNLQNLAVLVSGEHGYVQSFEMEKSLSAGFPFHARPGGCAQLCNDASTNYTTEAEGYAKCNVQMQREWDSKAHSATIVFKAKQKIRKGQELLYCYGPGYWKNKAERESVEQSRAEPPLAEQEFHSPSWMDLYQYVTSSLEQLSRPMTRPDPGQEVSSWLAEVVDMLASNLAEPLNVGSCIGRAMMIVAWTGIHFH